VDEAPATTADPDIDDRLRETIDAIRPAVQADGGDIFFHGIDDRGVVTVELVGACVSCPASTLTLKAGVERILKDRVPGVTSVISLGENDETVVSL
jgi:Fe-S cluster biogenesis protein NfuA